ncbi:ComF family protein [uncultured Friedmanniella sp.]|uniref:ComF family protein n=1 Tax=uncultured Friedmanniella sp. TaxID=335381 RepID=UPI0035CA4CAE
MGLEPWLAAAGDLLLGSACHGCGRPWWGVCPECRTRLRALRPYLTWPEPAPDGFPMTATCSPYDALARGLIVAHKERSALGLSPVLADRLAQAVHALLSQAAPAGPVVLVPVPSAAAAVRRRGYDATAALARLTARQLRGRHAVSAVPVLAQRAGVADQAGLDAAARRRNLAGALRIGRPAVVARLRAEGAVAVLVDDLVTTGSSLAEAARVLRGAGLPVLGAATVAATARRAA